VMSAVANAENNHQLDVDSLVVSEAYVGKNLIMKRFAARGRGRGFQVLKPFSQITIVVRETEAEAEAPRKATAKKGKGKAAAAPRKAAAKRPAQKPAKTETAAAEKEAE
ncbi:MAG: 50S ribosomal protein L22, partial [Hyphomicrobium sp.]|uniref:large ribosomal subunit protein uL22 n=1 Tax=Hyphomicrobium sp. TaxID=82 RepID=UPI003D0BCF46